MLSKLLRSSRRAATAPQAIAAGGNRILATAPAPATTDDDNEQLVSPKRSKVLRGARQRSRVLVDLTATQPPGSSAPPGILDGKFMLPAEQVHALQEEHGVTEEQLLNWLITPASKLARPPISAFHVGAVGLGASGALYVGVNLEFARLPLYNSVHAEQFLLVNALHHGERAIQRLAVSAAPCGHCRQFYSELACAESVRFMFHGGSYSLGQLLPMRFKPADLLPDPATPLLLEPQGNDIQLTAESQAEADRLSRSGGGGGGGPLALAVAEALREARDSYSPYSRCPAGAAVVTDAGVVYSGGYVESAAYNPSLPPLQTAIIDAVLDGMPCYTGVERVVLVELAGGPVRHAPTTRVILEQIAPGAALTVLHAEWR